MNVVVMVLQQQMVGRLLVLVVLMVLLMLLVGVMGELVVELLEVADITTAKGGNIFNWLLKRDLQST